MPSAVQPYQPSRLYPEGSYFNVEWTSYVEDAASRTPCVIRHEGTLKWHTWVEKKKAHLPEVVAGHIHVHLIRRDVIREEEEELATSSDSEAEDDQSRAVKRPKKKKKNEMASMKMRAKESRFVRCCEKVSAELGKMARFVEGKEEKKLLSAEQNALSQATSVLYVQEVVVHKKHSGLGLGYFLLDQAFRGFGEQSSVCLLLPDPMVVDDNSKGSPDNNNAHKKNKNGKRNAESSTPSWAGKPDNVLTPKEVEAKKLYKATFDRGLQKLRQYYGRMGFLRLDKEKNYMGLWRGDGSGGGEDAGTDEVVQRFKGQLPYKSIRWLCPHLQL